MKLTDIRGIGPKTEALFNRLGIFTAEDLLTYYPAGYEEYKAPCSIGSVIPGTKNSVRARITARPVMRKTRRMTVIIAQISDESGKLQLTWFNAPFVAGILKTGCEYVFRGTVREKNGQLHMDHPEIISPEDYGKKMNTLIPVYGLTRGLSGKTVAKAVSAVIDAVNPAAREYLPESIVRIRGLMDEGTAIRTVHFPADAGELTLARSRIVFDEFFLFILGIRMLKAAGEEAENAFPMKAVWDTEMLISSLPFKLTNAQLRAWHETEADLSGTRLMSRLIQGDVGSGKTVLAFLAMLMCAANGYQSALLAPTEVLAEQHYEKLCALKEAQKLDAVRPVLLTGAMAASRRKEVLEAVKNGDANCIVGTHTLFQEKVIYRELGLVITDEQHRFGVRQRNALRERGHMPHMLVMSATPIPRTLGVIFYGDLDISVVDELPARRLPVKNAVVDESYLENAWRFIERQLREGRQIYVVCPMIEASEDFDTWNVTDTAQVIRKRFPSYKSRVLHGRMKSREKNACMESFLRGETKILISTTVIEVGVDVPNASVMLILGAERFGLAQLHQLRGRVGRGEYQSYCVFLAGSRSESCMERLEVLRTSNDGFRIAERDFELRGPGDLLGIRQSGDAMFHMADVTRDGDILRAAGETCASVMQDDPALIDPDHAALKKAIENYLTANERKIVL